MSYTRQFVNPYPDGWVNYPSTETPINANALQKHTDAISGIDDYLYDNPIPANTSDLNNDDHTVKDDSYVHTDNNFTDELKDKLDGLPDSQTLDALENVHITSPSNGQCLVYDEVLEGWKNGSGGGGGGSSTLSGLDDVSLSDLADGEILVWNATTNRWVNSDILGDIASALDAINGEAV